MTMYDVLLRLYPASFRNEYGAEMRTMFEQRRRGASGGAVLALWAGTIVEVIGNAAAVHTDILRQDLAFTARAIRRSPGFALTAVAVIALGIGATTAAYSVTDFVLIRPLPFLEPDRLVTVVEQTPGYSTMELSAPNYRDLHAAARSFESLGVYHDDATTMTMSGEPRRYDGASVSADLFPTLGVTPLIGRGFTPDEDRAGAPGTVILSYRLWQSEFGGEPRVIGRSLSLDNEPYTVIGVMPREFNFPASDVLFWRANRFTAREYQDDERTNNWLYGVGRLRAGITLDEVRAELAVIAKNLERQHPKENKETGLIAYRLGAEISERSRLLLLALCGAAGCLLLIACANLANLLLARALSRRRELAVRAAIGAGRERLVRQLMTESLLLAIVGGAFGIGIAVVGVPLLARLVPATLPIASMPAVDVRILLFALLLTLGTGVAFGLAPVLRVGRTPDLDGLREGARSGQGARERVRSALVVAEIVASIVLLVSSGLLIRALLTVQAIDPGFKPDGVLTLRADLPAKEYERVSTREALYSRVLHDVRALPGVEAAGLISFLPMGPVRGGIWPVSIKGDPNFGEGIRVANNVAALRYVTPGYFDAMSIPIRRGRDIADSDAQDRPFVAVVSESFVKRYWPNDNPIGRRFTFAFAEREVVGVVGDVRFRGLERNNEPQVYLPSRQVEDGSIAFYAPRSLAVRTTVPPATLAEAVRAIVRRADPTVPITQLQTLDTLVGLETASRSVQVRVLGAFAAIAFILAAVGIHGLLSFAVAQRVNEFGVRMALGAQPRDILGMVVRRAALLAAAGIVPGMALAYAAGLSMQALLAGVKPADPITLAAAAALAAAMTIAGTLAPALRAAHVDPIVALRAE